MLTPTLPTPQQLALLSRPPVPLNHTRPRLRCTPADFAAQGHKLSAGLGGFLPAPQQPAAARTRVLCDCSVIPIVGPNPRYVYPTDGSAPPEVDAFNHPRFIRDGDTHAYMAAMGIEMAPMFYNGTFVGAPMWMGKTWDQVQGGRNLDYSLLDPAAVNPPRQDICDTLGLILRNPAIYHSAAKPHAPCIIDIEGANQNTDKPNVMTCDVTTADDVKVMVLNNWMNAILAIKRTGGAEQEVWCHDQLPPMAEMVFGGVGQGTGAIRRPADAVLDAWYALGNTFDAATVMHYWWDIPAENLNASSGLCGMNAASIERYAPAYAGIGGPRVVVLCPYFQIYFAANDLPATALLNNMRVPFNAWKQVVDWYASHGYWLYLWPGNGLVDDVRQHLQYAASYGFNYMPPPAGV